MPPLRNLCLDIPLAPAPTDVVKVIGIDLAKDHGTDAIAYLIGGVDQSKSRLHRIVQPPPIIDMAALDAASSYRLIDQMKDRKSMSLMDKMRQHYVDQLEPGNNYHRIDFVRAAFRAGKRWEEYADMALVVDRPTAYPSDFINDWIFGPHGEFTGFARVNVMEDLHRHAYAGGREGTTIDWSPRHDEVRHINFKVSLCRLSDRHHSLYDYQVASRLSGLDRNAGAVCFVRFATYHDYAAWEQIAARDPTPMKVSRNGR